MLDHIGRLQALSAAFYIERLQGGKMKYSYTYMVRCKDGSLYTGWTNDLDRRVANHNAGKGAKYTKSHRPVELVYYEAFLTKEEAMSREFAIKQLPRTEKEKLVQRFLKEKGEN